MSAPAETEFAGLEFDLAIGEVYGQRIWRMDDYGRLRAMMIPFAPPWRPGVNTAHCYAASLDAARSVSFGPGGLSFSQPEPSETTPTAPAHAGPSDDCKCGFYAYTIRSHAVEDSSGVVGIIRGTGRTLIGTKGFRCEKAEIVALLDPALDSTSHLGCRWMRDRLRANYPDVPLLDSRDALHAFAPITVTVPDPSSDEFWSLP